MATLTRKRQAILDFIVSYIDAQGISPSMADIVNACGLSSSSVAQYYLEALEREGFIKRRPDIPRSISLVRQPQDCIDVPLIGNIAAGKPIPRPGEDSWHNFTHESIAIPSDILSRSSQAYALRVKGKSMIDAHIDDGDIIILDAVSTVDDGQMAAVWLSGSEEVTLKKVYYEGSQVRLQPTNQEMLPIYVDASQVVVQGRVLGVIRKYGNNT